MGARAAKRAGANRRTHTAPPQRGDLIAVHWEDICADAVGNPDRARVLTRVTYALFWSLMEKDDRTYLITTDTNDTDDHSQSGYVIYPLGCVVELKVLKRARRKGS